MTKFARIVNETAIDVCEDPYSCFHPEIAKEFIEVPDEVVTGYTLNDGVWVAPNIPAIEVVQTLLSKKVSVTDFKLLFTPGERVQITTARATDPLVNDFFTLLDDPRLMEVDLSLASTKQIIEHLASIDIISSDRIDNILAGNPV